MDGIVEDVIYIEVDKDAYAEAEQTEVGACLLPEYVAHLLHALQFDNDLTFYKEVEPQVCLQGMTVVLYGHFLLPLHHEAALLQLIGQCFFIYGFEQSGAEVLIHVVDGSAYLVGYVVLCHGCCSLI